MRDIRAVRLTLGGICLVFVFWAMGIIYLLDHDLYAHVAAQRGMWPFIVLLSVVGSLALAGEVYSDILTLKSWLERGIFCRRFAVVRRVRCRPWDQRGR